MIFKIRRFPTISTSFRSILGALLALLALIIFVIIRFHLPLIRIFLRAGYVGLILLGITLVLLVVYSVFGRLMDPGS